MILIYLREMLLIIIFFILPIFFQEWIKVNPLGEKPVGRIGHSWLTLPGTRSFLYGGVNKDNSVLDEEGLYYYEYLENKWHYLSQEIRPEPRAFHCA